MGPVIVTSLRLILPLTILRWPLFGGLLSAIIDTLDVVFITFLNMGDFTGYHFVDKYLDMYYLTLECFISLSWKNKLAKKTSIFLYVYRAIGFAIFEVTKFRFVLFVFPNLFQNFYLFYLGYKKILKKDPVRSTKGLALILIILLIPKLAQEYMLHVKQVQPWNWIKESMLR